MWNNVYGKIEGCDIEAPEAWNCENKAISILGVRNWPEKARVEVDRTDETLLSHVWQRRKDRLTIGNHSAGNKALSSRARLVNGQI